MANSYYSISVTSAIGQIKAALEAKYGAGVVVHFQDAANIVFSCASLSNKVLKLNYTNSRLIAYYGDSWTTGSTITAQVQWGGYGIGACTFIDLILGSNTLMICLNQGTSLNCMIFLVGKLSNDSFLVLAMIGNPVNIATFLGKNLSDNTDIYPISFSGPFASASGTLFKQPLILQRADGKAEVNADGSIASFRDIYNCSHALPNTADLVGTNFLMSPANLFMVGGKTLYTSLIAEL